MAGLAVADPSEAAGPFVAGAGPTPGARSRQDYLEQRLFVVSPLGVWSTGAALYLLLAGLYALALAADGGSWLTAGPAGLSLTGPSRIALVLAFIVVAVLTLQRYSRLRDEADAPILARVLDEGASWIPPDHAALRLRTMTAVGAVVSLMLSLLSLPRAHASGAYATFAWFLGVSTLLGMLFFRGVELTRMGSRHAAGLVRGLKIDLLRIDDLFPWGRAAARTAMIWFTVSAATCFMFGENGLSLAVVAMLLACAGIGVWVFVSTLSLIHHRIRAAKGEALEGLRDEIAAARGRLDDDPAAPARLQSLLAYEARIAAAPEWPFDQTILVRVGASALILTVPWFGQAFAGLMVEHLGKAFQ
ncbi:hypothetical protein ACO2Q3_17670 [Caulobacter sp. KR2-114]|uniref:hypothetical protein n=1 Tax=Caulobacter sp. KR2-114 TaxID=3400912 RepID=UPI003BFBBF9D